MKKFIFKALISILILYLISRAIDVQNLIESYKEIKIAYIIPALILLYVTILTRTAKWQLILETLNIRKSFKKLCNSYIIGSLFTYFTPSGAGNDFYRCVKLFKGTDDKITALSSVIIERLTNVLSAVILLVLSLPIIIVFNGSIGLEKIFLYYFALIVLILITGTFFIYIIFIFLIRRELKKKNKLTTILKKIQDVFLVFKSLLSNKKAFIKTLVWGLLYYLIIVVSTQLMALSLNIHLSFAFYLAFVPLTTIITFIPITVQGLGLRETSFLYILAMVSIASADAVAFGFLVYVVGVLSTLPILVYYLIKKTK